MYNEWQADRIRRLFIEKGILYTERKMMGGLCFMVNDKMCCGLLQKNNTDLLMARIGPEAYEKAVLKPSVKPMDFTGRPMKGYIFVEADGIDLDSDLEYWIQYCLSYNPLAKSSKK
jgi:hypothetical protein